MEMNSAGAGPAADILPVAPEASRMLPLPFMRQYRVMPLRVQQQKLVLAMINPNDHVAIDNARAISGHEIAVFPTTEIALTRSFQKYFSTQPEVPLERELVVNEA